MPIVAYSMYCIRTGVSRFFKPGVIVLIQNDPKLHVLTFDKLFN